MSVTDIVGALATHGCSDLTSSVDLAACSGLPLAGGGFCDVYRGAVKGGTRVAIKSLRLYERPGKENDKAKILKRAARELYYWSKLKHPNVIPLMGLAIFRGHISMVSEWMDNGDLMSYISGNPGVDRTDLCVDICSGLLYIHENNMVHGDLKAANVMVSQDGIAMIADFGNSHLRDLTLKFTNTTNISFSLRWAAPEMFDEESATLVSKKADVYAFGMTVLEILTGKVPFDAFNEHQVLFMVASKRKTPVRPTVGMSDKTWQLLLQCWTWEQSERPEIMTVAEDVLDLLVCSVKQTGALETSDTSMFDISDLNPLLPVSHSIAPPNNGAAPPGQINLAELGLLLAKLLSARRRLLKRNHLDTVDNISSLAAVYFHQGRLAEAESLEDEVLAIRKQLLGDGHPDTMRSFASLERICSRQGKQAKSTTLMIELLAIQTQTIGGNHPATLRTMGILLNLYCDQSQLAEVELLGVRTLAAQKQVLGEDHPDALKSMGALFKVYRDQGKLAEAVPLGVQAIAAQKRVLGDYHPDTLRTMAALVDVYHDQGKLAETALLGAQILDAQKQVLGDDHPDTLKSREVLFKVYRDQGKLTEAVSFGIRTIAAQKRVLGGDHPDTLRNMATLAEIYHEQDNRTEMAALGNQTLAAQKQVLRSDQANKLNILGTLFKVYRDQGKLAEAASLGVWTIAAQRRALGEDHPDTLKSMGALFKVYRDQGKLAEAASLGVQTVAAQKRVLGDYHLDTLKNMAILAEVYHNQGKVAETASLGAQTLGAQKRVLGDDHPDTLRSMANLARLYHEQYQLMNAVTPAIANYPGVFKAAPIPIVKTTHDTQRRQRKEHRLRIKPAALQRR